MKVSVEKPKIISILYQQEQSDADYGSCLWARFYLDLVNYTMAIEGDAGSYTYGWRPTPDGESFLELLARIDDDYLLSKISNQTVVDGEETWKAIVEMLECATLGTDTALTWDVKNSLKEACCGHSDERDLVSALLEVDIPTSLWICLDNDLCEVYSCVVKDYPARAKTIVRVFETCVKPKIREMLDSSKEEG